MDVDEATESFLAGLGKDIDLDSDDEVVLPGDRDPKGYYLILGASRADSFESIRQKYKERSVLLHPDRHSHSDTFSKHLATVKFQQLTEAYNTLSNPQLRAAYDTSGLVGADATELLAVVPSNLASADLRRVLRMLYVQTRHRDILKTLAPHIKTSVFFDLAPPHPLPPKNRMVVLQLPSEIRLDSLASTLVNHGHVVGIPTRRHGAARLLPTNIVVDVSAHPVLPEAAAHVISDAWKISTTATADTRFARAVVELDRPLQDGAAVGFKSSILTLPWGTSGSARWTAKLAQPISPLSSAFLAIGGGYGAAASLALSWTRAIARGAHGKISATHNANEGLSIGVRVHGTRHDNDTVARDVAAAVGPHKAALWASPIGRCVRASSLLGSAVVALTAFAARVIPTHTAYMLQLNAARTIGVSGMLTYPPSYHAASFASPQAARRPTSPSSARGSARGAGGAGGGSPNGGAAPLAAHARRAVRRILSFSVGSIAAPLASLTLMFGRTTSAVLPVQGPVATSVISRWSPGAAETSWEFVLRTRTNSWHVPVTVASATRRLPAAVVGGLAALPFALAALLAAGIRRIAAAEDRALVAAAYAADATACKVRADIAAAYQRLVEESAAASAAFEQASDGLVIVNAKYGIIADAVADAARSGAAAAAATAAAAGGAECDDDSAASEPDADTEAAAAAAAAHPMYATLSDLDMTHGPMDANDAAAAAAAARLGPAVVYALRPRGWPTMIDVTRTLQALVARGRLVLPADGERARQDGFADPLPRALCGQVPRALQITYTFRGAVHRATIMDGQPIELPQMVHRMGKVAGVAGLRR